MELSPLQETLVLIFALIGTLFMLISAVGLLALPSVLARMHSAGQAATLGVGGLLIAAGIYFFDEGRLPAMIALVLLFFITGPVANTTMARAAYRDRIFKNASDPGRSPEEFQLERDDLADHLYPPGATQIESVP